MPRRHRVHGSAHRLRIVACPLQGQYGGRRSVNSDHNPRHSLEARGEGWFRCFPIVDGNKVVGVITRRDLLRAGVNHPDWQLRDAVATKLAALDSSGRYSVTVQAGVAEIEDFGFSELERSAAKGAAAAVPGIVAVTIKHQTSDPF